MIKVKKHQVTGNLVCFILIFFIQSCHWQQNEKTSTRSEISHLDKNDSVYRNDKIGDILIMENDTLLVGEVRIIINEKSDFLNEFRKRPDLFYYSNIEKRDFFLLHESNFKEYILIGAENGGCLSCVELVDFIDSSVLTKEMLPIEIQDTVTFKPHKIQISDLKILNYPFLKLNSNFNLIEKKMIDAKFKRKKSKRQNKILEKVTDLNVVTAFFVGDKIKRISVQLNIDL